MPNPIETEYSGGRDVTGLFVGQKRLSRRPPAAVAGRGAGRRRSGVELLAIHPKGWLGELCRPEVAQLRRRRVPDRAIAVDRSGAAAGLDRGRAVRGGGGHNRRNPGPGDVPARGERRRRRKPLDRQFPAFDPAAAGSLARWFSALLLLAGTAAASAVYSVRRHKLDDYQGRYRIWAWAAACCFLAATDTAAPLHAGFSELMSGLTGTRLLGDGSIWWIAPAVLLLGAVGSRLLVDMWECRASSGAAMLAVGCYAVAIVAHCGWLAEARGSAGKTLDDRIATGSWGRDAGTPVAPGRPRLARPACAAGRRGPVAAPETKSATADGGGQRSAYGTGEERNEGPLGRRRLDRGRPAARGRAARTPASRLKWSAQGVPAAAAAPAVSSAVPAGSRPRRWFRSRPISLLAAATLRPHSHPPAVHTLNKRSGKPSKTPAGRAVTAAAARQAELGRVGLGPLVFDLRPSAVDTSGRIGNNGSRPCYHAWRGPCLRGAGSLSRFLDLSS